MIPTNFQEIETLYRRLLQSKQKVFAVTAPAHGQGASSLGYAAARRCAKAGSKVLLVELQTRCSSLSETMAIPRHPWLPNPDDAEQAITVLDQGHLALLAAPIHQPLPLGFREPETLHALIDHWRGIYDFVFVETAPLNAAKSQEIGPVNVMRTADRVLMSVMPRKTTHQELAHAMHEINQAGTELLGVIANDRFNPLLVDEIKRQIKRIVPFRVLRDRVERWINTIPFLWRLP